jgi:hypothetical protein
VDVRFDALVVAAVPKVFPRVLDDPSPVEPNAALICPMLDANVFELDAVRALFNEVRFDPLAMLLREPIAVAPAPELPPNSVVNKLFNAGFVADIVLVDVVPLGISLSFAIRV